MGDVIFASVCFGPCDWFSHFLSAVKPAIDVHEHYQKQTWRNRYRIIGPNGAQDLVIPVRARNHTPLREVAIDYSARWQQQHWGAIRSGYGQSPFFAHYVSRIEPLYTEKKFERLVDFNLETLRISLDLLKVKKEWKLSEGFVPYTKNDLRLAIHPKKNGEAGKRYPQVVEDRHGFIPGVSVLDLLFCCGPGGKEFL